MRFLTSMGFSRTSYPATLAVPEVGGRKQVRMRIVVVLPAPLGPRKPTICPFSTSKEMLSTAIVRAYRLVRPSTLIILVVPSGADDGCHFGRMAAPSVSAQTVETFMIRSAGKACQSMLGAG